MPPLLLSGAPFPCLSVYQRICLTPRLPLPSVRNCYNPSLSGFEPSLFKCHILNEGRGGHKLLCGESANTREEHISQLLEEPINVSRYAPLDWRGPQRALLPRTLRFTSHLNRKTSKSLAVRRGMKNLYRNRRILHSSLSRNLEQEDHKFKASPGYRARPDLKNSNRKTVPYKTKQICHYLKSGKPVGLSLKMLLVKHK